MTVAWSSSINTIRLAPISKVPYNQRSLFQVQGGPPKISALSTKQLFLVTFDMMLSGTELDSFWSWWNTTANLGVELFTGLTDVVNDSSAVYQFIDLPNFNMVRAGSSSISRYRASMNLVQY
jgi:hypothetical protein